MAALSKRTWSPVYRDNDKWYTGYVGDMHRGGAWVSDGPHETRTLGLKPKGSSRGQSSVVISFEDPVGDKFLMAAKGFTLLLKQLSSGRVPISADGFFCVECMQVKQGQNIYIMPVEEEA